MIKTRCSSCSLAGPAGLEALAGLAGLEASAGKALLAGLEALAGLAGLEASAGKALSSRPIPAEASSPTQAGLKNLNIDLYQNRGTIVLIALRRNGHRFL